MAGSGKVNNGPIEFRNHPRAPKKGNTSSGDHKNKDVSRKNGRAIHQHPPCKHSSPDQRPPAPIPGIIQRSVKKNQQIEPLFQEMNNPYQGSDSDSGYHSDYSSPYSRPYSRTSSQNLDEFYSTSGRHSDYDSNYSRPYSRASNQNFEEFDAHSIGTSYDSNGGYMHPVSQHNEESDSASNLYLQPYETDSDYKTPSGAPSEYSHQYNEIEESPYSTPYSETDSGYETPSCAPSENSPLYDEIEESPYLYDEIEESPYLYDEIEESPYLYDEIEESPYLYDEIEESPYLYDKIEESLYSTPNRTPRDIRSSFCRPSRSIEKAYLTPVVSPKKPPRANKKEQLAPLSEPKSIQVAGHAANIVKLNNEVIAKLTTPAEADVYQWRCQLNLDLIIPKTVNEKTLRNREKQALAPLRKRSKKLGMEVIIPERLGAKIPEQRKVEMDIKLGYETASVEQLNQSGHPHPLMKKARHGLMDRLFKSKKRGYRVEGYKKRGEPVDQNRLSLTRNSNQHIKQLINDYGIENRRKILRLLTEIREQLQQADITFIASSLLVVVDTEDPENTQIKLIDLAHPVHPGLGDYQKYKTDLIKSLDGLISYAHRCIE